jgi:hypothetical protein
MSSRRSRSKASVAPRWLGRESPWIPWLSSRGWSACDGWFTIVVFDHAKRVVSSSLVTYTLCLSIHKINLFIQQRILSMIFTTTWKSDTISDSQVYYLNRTKGINLRPICMARYYLMSLVSIDDFNRC